MGNMLQGDLGPSYRIRGRDVQQIIGDNVWTSIQLGTMAFGLAVIVGIPLGVIAALRQNKWPDYAATFVSVIGIATPSFVLAVLLILVFSVNLHWFPTQGWRGPEYWVLPTIALSGYGIAQVGRYTRASMLEVTRRDYVRTAQSKGLKERTIVTVHMLRNAFIPVVTILGPLLAGLVTGSFVVESVFAIPGIGRFFVDAIFQRDYGIIMATTMLYAVLIAVMNLVVDVAYAWIDPRIRYS
jgi:oligopeptide transport system permease protein